MRVNEEQAIVYFSPEEAQLLYDVLFTKEASGGVRSWIEWSDIGSQVKELTKNVFAWKARGKMKAECPVYLSTFQKAALELMRYKGRKHSTKCHQEHLLHMIEWVDSEYTDRGDPPKWPCGDFPRIMEGLPEDEYQAVANQVKHFMDKVPKEGQWGDRKVWIYAMWKVLEKSSAFEGWNLISFKNALVVCNKRGLLALSRSDFPEGADPRMVKMSETVYLHTTFHLINR